MPAAIPPRIRLSRSTISRSDSGRPAVAVAFPSGHGHTAVIAEAVARGAADAGADVISVPVNGITEEQWAQLDAADVIIFGAPTFTDAGVQRLRGGRRADEDRPARSDGTGQGDAHRGRRHRRLRRRLRPRWLGPGEGLSDNAETGRLLSEWLASGKPVALVCHGPAALLSTVDTDGKSPSHGYRLTGLSNAEETQNGLAHRAKWLLQGRRVAGLGADCRETGGRVGGMLSAPHLRGGGR